MYKNDCHNLAQEAHVPNQAVSLGFVGCRVMLGQNHLPALRSASVSTIPAMQHTHVHLYTALMGRTSGRRLETLKQRKALSDAIGKLSTVMLYCLQAGDANSIYKQTPTVHTDTNSTYRQTDANTTDRQALTLYTYTQTLTVYTDKR
jgi:hypothetical protein